MRTLIWYEAIAAIISVVATTSGQSETGNASTSSSSFIQTSKLVGRKIQSFQGKEIGVIKDIIIDRSSGYIAYTVVSTGGGGTDVADGDGKIVAVPWAVYSPTSDSSALKVKVDRDKIYSAPAFEYARMDEYARPDYINNVYSYYGVSPGPRTAAGGSSGATAGTDVTGTARATVSPGQVASPAPIATVAPNKTPPARTEAASPASAHVSTADPSRKRRGSPGAMSTTRRPSATPEAADEEN